MDGSHGEEPQPDDHRPIRPAARRRSAKRQNLGPRKEVHRSASDVTARGPTPRQKAGEHAEISYYKLRLSRSISIVIPAYNEEKRLGASLEKIQRYLTTASWDFIEVIVVDDGSRDTTSQIARNAGVRLLENPGNQGKGHSVR